MNLELEAHTRRQGRRREAGGRIEAASWSPVGEEQTETEAPDAEQDGPPPGHPSIGASSPSLPTRN
jgi:hypothetical protein